MKKLAELLANATGRDKADIHADLLDDGELNFSAGANMVQEKKWFDKLLSFTSDVGVPI